MKGMRRDAGGWLAAAREWQHLGIDERDFASLRFDFSFDRIAAQVCDGTADVGVMPANNLEQLRGSCPGGFQVLRGAASGRIGRTTPPIVSSPRPNVVPSHPLHARVRPATAGG